MKKNNKKQVEQSTFKILGLNISKGALYQGVILSIIVIAGFYGFFHKKNMLEDSSVTIGKVVWIGRTPGKRVGQSECKYEYLVNGRTITKTSGRASNLDIKIGDCYEVKYSKQDPEISELEMKKGRIACKN